MPPPPSPEIEQSPVKPEIALSQPPDSGVVDLTALSPGSEVVDLSVLSSSSESDMDYELDDIDTIDGADARSRGSEPDSTRKRKRSAMQSSDPNPPKQEGASNEEECYKFKKIKIEIRTRDGAGFDKNQHNISETIKSEAPAAVPDSEKGTEIGPCAQTKKAGDEPEIEAPAKDDLCVDEKENPNTNERTKVAENAAETPVPQDIGVVSPSRESEENTETRSFAEAVQVVSALRDLAIAAPTGVQTPPACGRVVDENEEADEDSVSSPDPSPIAVCGNLTLPETRLDSDDSSVRTAEHEDTDTSSDRASPNLLENEGADDSSEEISPEKPENVDNEDTMEDPYLHCDLCFDVDEDEIVPYGKGKRMIAVTVTFVLISLLFKLVFRNNDRTVFAPDLNSVS